LSTAILFNAELYVYRPVDQLGQVSATVSRWMDRHKHSWCCSRQMTKNKLITVLCRSRKRYRCT